MKKLIDIGYFSLPVDGLNVELDQATDEGKDVGFLRDEVNRIVSLEDGDKKKTEIMEFYRKTQEATVDPNYPYDEPSNLEAIRKARPKRDDLTSTSVPSHDELYDKVYGAWLGRCAGCLLGKPVESWTRADISGFAKDTNNFPLQSYFSSDVSRELREKYNIHDKLQIRPFTPNGDVICAWINNVDFMPVDDDTNYTVLGLKVIENYGRNFTSENIAEAWVELLPAFVLATAERVAYRNIISGHLPPASAIYMNPYREYIGAQIRGDFFGYVNPGNPELAAEFAHRDASVSHIKNGIYGEMFIAAMLAAAAISDDIKAVIIKGISEIPVKSRLYEGVYKVLGWYDEEKTFEQVLDLLYEQYNERNPYHWCHTVPNAMIVVASLLYGKRDFETCISNAVLAGLDTDCNGASVGSIIGMMIGAKSLPKKWISPLNDRMSTSVSGYQDVKISEMAKKTVVLIERD